MHHRSLKLTAAGIALATLVAACGGDDSGGSSTTAATGETTPGTTGAPSSGGGELTLLFGSSGDAETNALTAATQAYTAAGGAKVTVTPAQDLTQQLAQGFASGKAPDVFYVGADQVANYAKAGNLYEYGDQLSNAGDFSKSLTEAFTYDGKLVCAPKDASTLALFINTDDWAAAGLTDADIPTTWDQLADVAKKLTTDGRVGLSFSASRDRIDSFLVQNGGYLTGADNEITANSDQNVAALTFVKQLLTDGSLKYPGDVSAGWGGEAFGKNAAAMTIEGNWLLGPLSTDYPTIKYKVVELPTGPSGDKGTLVFTNCWGISATSSNQAEALKFVEYLTKPDVQLEFSKAFGVIPSIESAQTQYLAEYPDNKPFVDGITYAKGVVALPGITDVLNDFDSQLQALATSEPKTILDSVQQNLEAAAGG